jgi:gamma-glutamylcyclotransferase (GGCT)/AIG2-like uncharacterized protein YtfP
MTDRAPPPAVCPGGGSTPTDLLFVYGTLMRGLPLHGVLLAGGAAFLGPATVSARLFDLGPYPAAVPDASGIVRGELYRIGDPSLWARLDSLEGSQYHRRESRVRLTGDRGAIAHVYWYVGPLGRAVPIRNGDYRTHAPARSLHGRHHEEER